MSDFDNYFTLYESTDPPPILTEGYKQVRENFLNNYFLSDKDDTEKVRFPPIFNYAINLQLPSYNTSTKLKSQLYVPNFPMTDFLNPLKSTDESTNTVAHKNNIINYFLNKGLTLNLSKGIYGNLMRESAGKINAISKDGHNSYGLALWTGERKQRLFSMYGNNPTELQQLDFLWWELNNTHKSTLNSLRKTTSIYDATKVFMDKFERPHPKYANFNKRLQYAQSK